MTSYCRRFHPRDVGYRGTYYLYPSARIKVSSCQISLKSVQWLNRESVTDRWTELLSN